MATDSYVQLNPTYRTDGAKVATLEDGGEQYQKVILAGLTDGGVVTDIPVTAEGHLEVALHAPRLPFGSIHTESLHPVAEGSFVYGVNPDIITTRTGLAVGTGANSGSVGAASNLMTCATGTTQFSFATAQSRRRVRYRPGQGIVARFTSLYSAPAASSILVAGVGSAEAGFFFGYNGTSFGILHSTGGVREIHTLTITTASTATNDYVITLPNTATVNVTATNNASTVKTAYEIAQGTFPGWTAEQRGSTVVFLASSAGPVSGSFSLAQTGAATPAAGTDAETLAGVASTDTWIPQTSWNGDVMDGSSSASNPSGVLLDKTKGNVYQIGIQYLGFGAISFAVEVTDDVGNNPDFLTVHTIRAPNTRTSVTASNPSFPFTMAAYSVGSTANVSVSCGSFSVANEGEPVNLGPRSSYYVTTGVSSSTSAYVPLFTVRNSLTYGSRANQIVSQLISVTSACKSTNGLTSVFLIRNATLTGTPNFTLFSTNSCTYWDTAATGCSFANNGQIVWVGSVSESGQLDFNFADREITLQPGETLTLAVRSVTSTATCVGSINMREDQ